MNQFKFKQFKRWLAGLSFVIGIPMTGYAESVEIDGLLYELNATERSATVTSYDATSLPVNVIIPETVTYSGNSYNVTVIAAGAFANCTSMESVSISGCVVQIGYNAFGGCKGLASVIIGNSVTEIGTYSFRGCSSLSTLTIGNSVAKIGGMAFNGCKSLTSLTIPKSVTTIENQAFSECTGLKSLNFEDGVKPLSIDVGKQFPDSKLEKIYLGRDLTCSIQREDDGTFSDQTNLTAIIIGRSVTTINNYTFRNCNGLTTLFIPNSVTQIGHYAFSGGIGLKQVKIEDGTTPITLGGSVFSVALEELYLGRNLLKNALNYYPNLKTVILGDCVTYIASNAFSNCSSLASVAIPNSVTSIRSKAFYECAALTAVKIPNTVDSIGENAFRACSSLTAIEIPASVRFIGAAAFSECNSMREITYNAVNCEVIYDIFSNGVKKVTIGTGVKSIPDDLFSASLDNLEEIVYNAENCEVCGEWVFSNTVKKLTFGNSVKTIPANAFARCSGITTIEIPSSVNSIGNDAFRRCVSLTEVVASSVGSWLNIDFKNEYANPLVHAKKLIIDGASVRRLTIPEGITRINAHAFVNCESIVTVNFPSGLKSVGDYTFKGATSLQRFVFGAIADFVGIEYDSTNALLTTRNNGKIYINDQPYQQEEIMVWPENIKHIPAYAFYNNSIIRKLIIPKDLQSIGEGAFYNATSFNQITYVTDNDTDSESRLPSGMTTIEPYTFCKSSLTAMILPNTVTSIGEKSFCECRIRSIAMPAVTTIGINAFQKNLLTSLEIPNSVTTIGESAFEGNTHLTSIEIPSGVTYIGEGAFQSCYLDRVVFNGTPRFIGGIAFDSSIDKRSLYITNADLWCSVEMTWEMGYFSDIYVNGTKVENLVLRPRNKVVNKYTFYEIPVSKVRIDAERIEEQAFYKSDVQALCINTNYIGPGAFGRCNRLNAVYSMTEEPPVASDNAFDKYEGVKLYVPVGARSRYENAENCWWKFLDIIETDFSEVEEMFKANYTQGESGIVDMHEDMNKTVDFDLPYEIFNLNGIRVGSNVKNIPSGIYILRQNGRAVKYRVK